MKKSNSRLKLEKFKITKLSASRIRGGDGDNDGNTATDGGEKKCVLGSLIETDDENENGQNEGGI